MAAMETQKAAAAMAAAKMGNEVEFAKCDCCGLTEECTEAYIKRVRERFQGRWICGLCEEAVKDEVIRSKSERGISCIGNEEEEEEALNRHMSFCKKFRSSLRRPPPDPTQQLISAVKQLLLRSLDSSPPPPPSPMRAGKPPSMLRSKS
ncbi:hypothetical protein M9H77_19444 [Catharanthus roseus]|uniref:Uncharacterized protein n=1 Tax=Catharanthus roseus TaxID=4058 RepID=A0ACC0BAC3_CATRO|nr:hypothetical protein M9H77_19444 [Catharanthus roseus]